MTDYIPSELQSNGNSHLESIWKQLVFLGMVYPVDEIKKVTKMRNAANTEDLVLGDLYEGEISTAHHAYALPGEIVEGRLEAISSGSYARLSHEQGETFPALGRGFWVRRDSLRRVAEPSIDETKAPVPLPETLPDGTRTRHGHYCDSSVVLANGEYSGTWMNSPSVYPGFVPSDIDWPSYYQALRAQKNTVKVIPEVPIKNIEIDLNVRLCACCSKQFDHPDQSYTTCSADCEAMRIRNEKINSQEKEAERIRKIDDIYKNTHGRFEKGYWSHPGDDRYNLDGRIKAANLEKMAQVRKELNRKVKPKYENLYK